MFKKEWIRSAKVVISQLEIADDAILEGFRIAHSAGVLTILNPAPARPAQSELITLADFIIPNETEAELLTGVQIREMSDAVQASTVLLDRGAKNVIITLGKVGALLVDRKGHTHFPSVEVEAVDTTGAGDAFIGSFAYALSRDKSLPFAIEFANHAAALAVTKVGTQVAFPSLSEVEQLMG
jgi:ribokinase